LHNFTVGQILAADLASDQAIFKEWQHLIEEKALPLTIAGRGQTISLPGGALIEVLNPAAGLESAPDDDAMERRCLGLRVSRGLFSFLLTADIDQTAEYELLGSQAPLEADILKVAHHGSANASCEAFLAAARPQTAVISCGSGNRFGHPSAATLQKLSHLTVYRTDLHGSIEFITDGEQLWVKTDRRE